MATLLAASFKRTGDTGDLSNKLYIVDKNTKSDIRKYFALRFNVIFISLLLKSRIQLFQCQTITLRLGVL